MKPGIGRRYKWLIGVAQVLLIALATASLQAGGKRETTPGEALAQDRWNALLPAGPGKEYATALCSRCHTVGVLILQKRSRGTWRDSLLGMNSAHDTGGELCACLGGPIADDEIEILSSYLSEAFGPKNPIDQLPLNINTATLSMLMRLPGLGVPDAQRIVAHRNHAPFKSKQEIENLLGRDKFHQIESFVDVKDSNFRSDGMLTM